MSGFPILFGGGRSGGLFLNGVLLTSLPLYSSPINVGATGVLNYVGGNSTTTLSGAISGSGTLVINANIISSSSSTQISGAVSVGTGYTYTLGTSQTFGNISGVGGNFNINSGCVMILNASASNSFTGGILGTGSINVALAGAMQTINNTAAPTAALTTINTTAGSLTWNNSSGSTINYFVGTLAMSSGCSITIGGASNINMGSYQVNFNTSTATGSTLTYSSNCVLSGNVTYNAGSASAYSATIAGACTLSSSTLSFSITHRGTGPYDVLWSCSGTGGAPTVSMGSSTGLLCITGTLPYSALSIGGGTVQIGTSTITPTFSTGTITVGTNGALVMVNASSSVATYTGAVSGGGPMTLTGTAGSAGIYAFSNMSAYTGTVTLSSACLQLTAKFGSGAQTLTIAAGSQVYGLSGTISNALNLAGTGWDVNGAVRADGATFSGAVTLSASATIGQGVAASSVFNNTVAGATYALTVNPYAGGSIAFSGVLSGLGSLNSGGAGTTIVSSNSSSVAWSVAAGAGFGGGALATGTVSSITIAGASSFLTSNAITTTSISKLTCTTLTASSGFVVNLAGTMSAGTYTLISCSGTLPSTLPTIGTNTTGRTPTFNWTAGTGLTVTLV